jgi:transcriptional regulator with XRE-family HTH domain
MTPSGGDETDSYPSPDALTDKQLETLRAIASNPEATQRELASELGVTAATISRRVNDIRGFEWGDRRAFATEVLDTVSDGQIPSIEEDDDVTQETDQSQLDELTDRVANIESQLAELSTDGEAVQATAFEDAELAHKIVHACMESERITEDEELRVLKTILE